MQAIRDATLVAAQRAMLSQHCVETATGMKGRVPERGRATAACMPQSEPLPGSERSKRPRY
jgi:hypothetical protein